jgi:hypothetical protein
VGRGRLSLGGRVEAGLVSEDDTVEIMGHFGLACRALNCHAHLETSAEPGSHARAVERVDAWKENRQGHTRLEVSELPKKGPCSI